MYGYNLSCRFWRRTYLWCSLFRAGNQLRNFSRLGHLFLGVLQIWIDQHIGSEHGNHLSCWRLGYLWRPLCRAGNQLRNFKLIHSLLELILICIDELNHTKRDYISNCLYWRRIYLWASLYRAANQLRTYQKLVHPSLEFLQIWIEEINLPKRDYDPNYRFWRRVYLWRSLYRAGNYPGKLPRSF